MVNSSGTWLLFLLRFLLNAFFLQSLKILHMHFMKKNVPAKRDEIFTWEKTSHHENGIPVRREDLFSYKHIYIFNITKKNKKRFLLTEALTLLGCFFFIWTHQKVEIVKLTYLNRRVEQRVTLSNLTTQCILKGGIIEIFPNCVLSNAHGTSIDDLKSFTI